MPRLTRFLALLAVLAIVQPVAVAQAAEQVVISDGHVDLGPRFADGQWTVQLRDDTGDEPKWRALSDVVLHVAEAAKTAVPDDPAYDFLGDRGSPIWVLPQVEQDGVVWPGWNTQDPEVTAAIDREVTWRLHGVRGPGRFVLFLSGNFGAPTTIFTSTATTPQETGIEVGTHVHGNWVFGAPGTYLLDLEMAASTKDRGEVADRRVLRVHVGDDTDPRSAFDVAVAEPEQQAEPAPEPADSRWWVWVGLGGALLVVAAVVVVVVRRRRGER
ncbi:TIGR03773 family transporter-associated surface protein [Saccharothrix deserti]|uniref:TIGR03773 family transporter-associated surface protein n=1 Tax=Saccharothrix deserti TaxID=2593674 RepID=UPI00131AF759|nr:TIGR03773 family transporter-associated surface protein [Saccharothrix deserti]